MSHLFFADDLLLFVKARPDKVDCIKEGLNAFCRASGQRINYNKSHLFISSNVANEGADSLCTRIGIPLTMDLGRYLGHRLAHRGRNRHGYGEILQRVRDKLDGWKTRCLSRAGRLTLARSVLGGIGIFQMQIQQMPTCFHKEMDKYMRQCVWGSSPANKKIHLLNWDTLCKPKKHGGAGL